MKASVTGAFSAEMQLRMLLAHRRQTPEDIRFEYLPPEQCRAVSPPPGEHYCTLLYGHKGPCSWRRK